MDLTLQTFICGMAHSMSFFLTDLSVIHLHQLGGGLLMLQQARDWHDFNTKSERDHESR